MSNCIGNNFTYVYYFNPNDFIWKNGQIVRQKRKYGKKKRVIYKQKL